MTQMVVCSDPVAKFATWSSRLALGHSKFPLVRTIGGEARLLTKSLGGEVNIHRSSFSGETSEAVHFAVRPTLVAKFTAPSK